jgi:hypothetical protein
MVDTHHHHHLSYDGSDCQGNLLPPPTCNPYSFVTCLHFMYASMMVLLLPQYLHNRAEKSFVHTLGINFFDLVKCSKSYSKECMLESGGREGARLVVSLTCLLLGRSVNSSGGFKSLKMIIYHSFLLPSS